MKINELIQGYNLLIEEILTTKFDENREFSFLTDRVVLGLLRSVLDKSKSLNYLMESQMYPGADTLLRSIFETATYLEFILKEDTKDRAEAYILSSKIKTLKIHEKSMLDDELGKTIREMTGMSEEYLNAVYTSVTKKDEIKNRYRSLVGNLNPDKWYKVNGNKSNSFRDVCEYLGQEKLAVYEIIYRILSQDTHGKEAENYFEVKGEELVMTPIQGNSVQLPLLRSIINNSGYKIVEKYECKEFFMKEIIPIIKEIKSNNSK